MQPKTPKQYKEAYERHKKAGNKDNAARVAQLYRQHLAQQQSQAKDGAFEGYGDAFMRGIDQPLENMGVTAEALGQEKLAQT